MASRPRVFQPPSQGFLGRKKGFVVRHQDGAVSDFQMVENFEGLLEGSVV